MSTTIKKEAKATKVTDFLKEDPPVYGQDWMVISLVSPEDMVVKKNLYYNTRFLVADVNKTISAQAQQMAKFTNAKIHNQMADVLDRLNHSVDEDDKRAHEILSKQLQNLELDEDDLVDECRRQYELDDNELLDRFKQFLVENRIQLDREFDQANDHRTSTRGIKIRGVYQRMEDARGAAKKGTEFEPAVNSFVAPVGKWIPVDFEADEAQDQEYMMPQLNDLMKKYHDNMHSRRQHMDERRELEQDNAKSSRRETQAKHLQDILRKRRNEKMRKEMEALDRAGTSIDLKERQQAADYDPAKVEAELAREFGADFSSGKKKSKKSKKHKSAAN